VGTTLAILERQLKTMSAVQARVHASLRMEFKLLKGIIRDFLPSEYPYTPEGGDRSVKQADYDVVEVIPVSDPNAATMAQRIMQYQAALQLAQGAPQIYDLPQLCPALLQNTLSEGLPFPLLQQRACHPARKARGRHGAWPWLG
jgi:hypothetical protein